MTDTRRQLPIYEIEGELKAAFRASPRLIIQAPTGSGKSTQIPQMLVDNGLCEGQVVILQPRRIAARMLATRVAQERGGPLADEVGYQIRFQDRSSQNTRIKYVTEGILLRQILGDPLLRGISTVVFDEFHERHVYGDVTLGRALQIQKTTRPDLKIIVMSATLDSDALASYLAPCRVLTSSGRMHPVDIAYLDREPDPKKKPLWSLVASELERLMPETRGDVLVFMPGAYEISRTLQALQASPVTRGCTLLPLHGELPPEQQDAAVARYDRRKIVVATNVAETSLTIDGITLVIDSGMARVARFDPYRGINTLLIERISRASAEQRTGRAGRTAPGRCLRLWTRADHESRQERDMPEILRVDLAEILLTLKAGSATEAWDLASFPWLTPPTPRSVARAELLLRDLGATDDAGTITALGHRLIAFPVHPRYARMLLAAHELGCVPSIALIAALTQDRSLLLPRQGEHVTQQRELKIGEDAESDFLTLIRAWDYADRNDYSVDACRQVGVHAMAARQVRQARANFLRIAQNSGLDVETDRQDAESVARCVLLGFSDHVAHRPTMGHLRCELVHKRAGTLSRESVVRKSALLVACEVREIEGRELNVVLSLATAIKPEWLEELFPNDLKIERHAFFDESIKRAVVETRRLFRDLVLETKRGGDPNRQEAAALLAEQIMAGKLGLNQWDAAVEQWILRLNCLAGWCPDLGLPQFTDEDKRTVLDQFCLGAFSHKDVKDKPIWSHLKQWLSAGQQALLDKYAPERVNLPNGRSAKVTYATTGQPSIALPIQSLYGVESQVKIAMGRVPLLIQILAPSHRPVQITQDLANFWKEQYPKVKKELQRKYPKHEWR